MAYNHYEDLEAGTYYIEIAKDSRGYTGVYNLSISIKN